MNIKAVVTLTVLAILAPVTSQALTITLGGAPNYEREASLADASAGFFGTGNATAETVDGYFGSLSPWTEQGSVERNSGSGIATSGLLTVNVTSGSWGSANVSGTWTINSPTFWTTYENAAISMHVGNGGGDPDHFVWLITQGQTSGTWSFKKLSGGGAGLSNIKLYSSDVPTSVPDGGSTLALAGLALTSLALLRRKLA